MPNIKSNSDASSSSVLGQCCRCFGHFKLRPDGGLRRHGGKHKGEECPGSYKVPNHSHGSVGSNSSIPLSSSSINPPQLVPFLTKLTVSEIFMSTLANKLKIIKIYEHVPKASREAVANSLSTLLYKLCDDPYIPDHWIRLACFAPYVLAKPNRGGRRFNSNNFIVKKLKTFNDLDVINLMTSFESTRDNYSNKGTRRNWVSAVLDKIESGNLKSAVQILCSVEGLAENTDDTLERLKNVHPQTPMDRRVFPTAEQPDVQLLSPQVLKAVKSFHNGSAAGLDGLRPQHLKDLISAPIQSEGLLTAVTLFMNTVVKGICPPTLLPFFFGGRLVAVAKKDGGVRPIAVGNTWRRLASKCALLLVQDEVKSLLHPFQVGVGVRGGAEAAIHSVRSVVNNFHNTWCLLKIDFKNAFNSVRRDTLLEAAKTHLPSIYNYCLAAYGQISVLGYQNQFINSCEGVHQGDPLGPMLFSVAIHPLLTCMVSAFKTGYLDDVCLADRIDVVSADYDDLKIKALAMGLTLNVKKCEVFSEYFGSFAGDISINEVPRIPLPSLTFLGAPVVAGAFQQNFLVEKLDNMKFALRRALELPRHDALTIIRHSLWVPRLMYCLRTSQITDNNLLENFNKVLRDSLAEIINVDITDRGWLQAQLPLRYGGLGLTNVAQLATISFRNSAAATFELQMHLLNGFTKTVGVGNLSNQCCSSCSQKQELEKLHAEAYQNLSSPNLALEEKARLLAVTSDVSYGWLRAWPNTSLGTRLDDECVRTSVALRLGLRVHGDFECKCGEKAERKGYHGLACRLGGGRQLRHSALNDFICRLFSKASIPTSKEPSGLSMIDNKRPDGCTLIPWKKGKCLAWDVTIPDTVAVRYLHTTSQQRGGAAIRASDEKFKKYQGVIDGFEFSPICVECFGPMDPLTRELLVNLCDEVQKRSGDPKELYYAINYVSVILQRMNYFCIKDNVMLNADGATNVK